ncbi:MAG: hypothetical protein ACP5IB_08215 [Thermoplasmata archaeon]
MILNCPYLEKCNAPLCPFFNFQGIWYADEEVCKNPEYSKLNVIKNQKKISRINRRHEVQGLFTFNMLNRSLIVKRGISGLSEDLEIQESGKSELKWIRKHRGMSKELKNSLGERLKMNEGTKKEGFTNA